jgi:drug/metabolite transporter (DMT)-like permease
VPVVLVGALTIAFSAILYRLADVSPATGAFFRCFWALPALWVLARVEGWRFGARSRREHVLAWAAGAFFAADLILWHNSIEQVGAGLSTVLANTQVVLVPLLAWLILRERAEPGTLAAIPIVAVGVLLISGLLEAGAYGANPPLGALFGILTGIAYAGFLLTLREGNRDDRRPAGPLFDATLSAALACAAYGIASGELDVAPSWQATGWLIVLALSSQVVGWLLISISLPRLSAALGSVMLTFQPACSVVLAALILGESPSALQVAGVAATLAGLVAASATRRARLKPVPAQAGSPID